MAYTKLFAHIITSTIWDEDDQTRILWITMLALSNKFGEVMASVPGLAHTARLSAEATRKALACLEAPDPDSRTPDEEGRRIVKIDGGWHIINYEKHRRMASLDERREQARIRKQRQRKRKKEASKPPDVTPDVTKSHTRSRSVTVFDDNAEAEAKAEVPESTKLPSSSQLPESTKKPESVGDNGSRRSPQRITIDHISGDEGFIAEVQEAYPYLVMEDEIRKAILWLKTPRGQGKALTRQRFLNWCARCDKPVQLDSTRRQESREDYELMKRLGAI